MKQSILAITGAFTLLSLGAFGCGDDGGSSGSGVASDKPVSEVTDAEAKKVCEWASKQAAAIVPSKKQLCTFAAIPASSTAAECNQFVEACVEDDSIGEFEPEGGDDCSDVSAEEAPDCDVTVGEYETCMKDFVDAFKQQFSALSCSDAGSDPEIGSSETPAACEKIEAECPELLPDMGVDESLSGNG